MALTSTSRHPSRGRFLPPDSNPFATRFIRPGAMPFHFHGGGSAHDLVAQLESNNWWGQILGPHGSGKSTLIATLEPALTQHGRDVIHLRLHESEHALPKDFFASNYWTKSTQLVVDGYEQLGWLSKRKVKRHCRQQGCGLLVSSHADVGLPTIFETKPSADLAQWLTRELLEQHGNADLCEHGPFAASKIAELAKKHGGNVREVLFELYDLYESNRATDG